MGVKERKAREKAALRAKIIETANALFLERGYEGTSIRQIAQAIEYSPATIYLYFKDKEDLFQEILDAAFASLQAALENARIIADPLSRLQELCRRYLDFSRKQSNYYDLIFANPASTAKEGEQTYAGRIHQYFIKTIQDCKREGYFLSKSADALATVIWSFIHGQAMLRMDQRLDHLAKIERERLEEESLQTFFAMLRSF
ncbi:MAG TPA: TetR/AcrR family transcriptional regulator [Saprospiraceae bacterium]|nr:TetR/AcrR family transcriptional regulator [Saprospiraceae bacterium]